MTSAMARPVQIMTCGSSSFSINSYMRTLLSFFEFKVNMLHFIANARSAIELIPEVRFRVILDAYNLHVGMLAFFAAAITTTDQNTLHLTFLVHIYLKQGNYSSLRARRNNSTLHLTCYTGPETAGPRNR